jgi:hypothetical protein
MPAYVLQSYCAPPPCRQHGPPRQPSPQVGAPKRFGNRKTPHRSASRLIQPEHKLATHAPTKADAMPDTEEVNVCPWGPPTAQALARGASDYCTASTRSLPHTPIFGLPFDLPLMQDSAVKPKCHTATQHSTDSPGPSGVGNTLTGSFSTQPP